MADPSLWIAQAVNAGNQVYQIEINLTSGFSEVSCYITLAPYIAAQ